MSAVAQLSIEAERSEPFLYHDAERPGFVAVLQQQPNGRKVQRCLKLAELPTGLESFYGLQDVWISQGQFYKPNRRVVNLWRMPVAFVDIDTYKLPGLASLSPESHTDRLLTWCVDQNIAPPSLVVFSGRGLQVKWLIREPVPKGTLPRWHAVQRRQNALLEGFGADSQAMDASRVLRLVDTCSSRSGERVRVLHTTTTPTHGGELLPTGVVGYDFDVLADSLLPIARVELATHREGVEARRQQDALEQAVREARNVALSIIDSARLGANVGRSGGRRLVASQLAWDRLSDLRTLARLRECEDGLPPGQRDLFVFLGACFLADACVVHELPPEVVELAREFAPTWSNEEAMSCVSSVMARARAAERGETVKFRGLEVPPKYRWRNETLVERLAVTPAEERQLRAIISRTECTRRDTERHAAARRAAGCVPREDWLAAIELKRQRARALRQEGWTFRGIAKELDVSPATAKNYCR